MNREERDQLRAKHRNDDWAIPGQCNECGSYEYPVMYPCDVIQVLDAWEATLPWDVIDWADFWVGFGEPPKP